MNQRGSGTSEAMLIGGIAAFFLFLGLYGNSLGYVSDTVGRLGSWSLPYVHLETGGFWHYILMAISSITDILTAIINIFLWVIQCLASYAALMAYSVQGEIPIWVSTILFIVPTFILGWLVLSLVRGRE